jgi:hypothetical protein
VAITGVAIDSSGTVSVADSTGTQTSTSAAWRVGGNSGTGPLGFGTTATTTDIDLILGNTVRGRYRSNGEFNFGAVASPYLGNLLSAMSTTALPFAVNGFSTNNGSGVWGEILASGTTAFSAVQGVYGGSGNGSGVLGNYAGTNTSGTRAGVSGVVTGPAAASGGAGVSGLNNIASGNQRMGVLGQYNGSAFGLGVVGIAFGGGIPSGNQDIGVVGWRANNANYSGYFNGNHVIANGTKSASVATSRGNQLLYATESPEVWFEDIGGGQLVNGTATVNLDPLYLETVHIDERNPIRVFIQMEGESGEVYVVKGSTGFSVRERAGGRSNAAFSYRVMAKRKNFQDHRFGNDPVWGPGDTRRYAEYAPPPPIDYAENLRFQAANRNRTSNTPVPAGFVSFDQLQQRAAATAPAADRKSAAAGDD